MSFNLLQKFRLYAGEKVNRDFNGPHTVYNILCATSDCACARSITPCILKGFYQIRILLAFTFRSLDSHVVKLNVVYALDVHIVGINYYLHV